MKLRNLFLTTAVCAGLFSACSNELDNVIDNNGPDAANKDAFMQINFAMPASGGTTVRADEQTEAGTDAERGISSVALIITDGSLKITDKVTLTAADFSPVGTTGGQPGANNLYYYSSNKAIAVKKQDGAKVYVYVNPNATINALAVDGTLNEEASFTETDNNLTAANRIAATNNFFMSNLNGTAKSANINGTKANPTKVEVTVERVVAKLVESTKTAAFTVDGNGGYDTELAITMKQFGYYNLNKSSYVLQQFETVSGDKYTKDLNFNAAPGVYTNAFFYPNTATDFTSYNPQTINGTGLTTYCLENTDVANNQWTDKTTGVIYKAVASWGGNAAKTFYIYTHKVYLDWATLKTDFEKAGSQTLANAESTYTYESLKALGITKYTNGECYYRVAIKHNVLPVSELKAMEYAVVRNNVYKLKVNSVSGLGEPVIPTEPEPDKKQDANIDLTVNVQPWTVRDSGFDL